MLILEIFSKNLHFFFEIIEYKVTLFICKYLALILYFYHINSIFLMNYSYLWFVLKIKIQKNCWKFYFVYIYIYKVFMIKKMCVYTLQPTYLG